MSKNYWLSFPFGFFSLSCLIWLILVFSMVVFQPMKTASSKSLMTLNFFHQILNYKSFASIFEQLMKMSKLSQLLMLLSQEEFLLISEKQQNLELFISTMLIISKAFFEITIPKIKPYREKNNSTIQLKFNKAIPQLEAIAKE